ncbi:membrane transporter [Trichophyton tonsurans CBS 112818]|uniref:MFS multidrug transporter n=2 Tax=Trichophyton TaxID=5550 RepID=F2PVK8_TRIEC|nr:membrane transporter [Trichophyton tonsurans CBS 112818]EGE05926.1 MFS multidrug transporter [Trichophyton equinum CBS 127.97]
MGTVDKAPAQIDGQLKEIAVVANPGADPEILAGSSLSEVVGNDDEENKTLPIGGTYKSSYRCRRVASKTVLSFQAKDPENPINWSTNKKLFILFSGIMNVLNSTLGSSLPSGAISYIAREFNIRSAEQLTLPISLFLLGYVFGPIVCGPLSESYGRKPVVIVGFAAFMLFTLACALSQSWAALLAMRFFVGVSASAPIAVVGGVFADVYDEPRTRGRYMAFFMASTCAGPIVGPPVTGFISAVNWRWSFWVGLIFAGLTAPIVLLTPETYAPVLLQQRARKLRKETGDDKIVSALDLEKKGIKETLTVTLTRPIRMIIFESIVLFTCLYLALVYAIFFMYFQTYPLIFQKTYHMSPGIAGLMYLPIGAGVAAALGLFFCWDSYLNRAKLRNAPWAGVEEYRRLPLAVVGGPLFVISLFWLGWTASPNIHWSIPMLSGIPFGAGFLLIFIAMINYLSDAYETFSASAQSAASFARSILGTALPVAAGRMYSSLGISWGCSLLAFASLAMTAIPFAFIRYGDRIRAGSLFCQHLKQLKEQKLREDLEEEASSQAAEKLVHGADQLDTSAKA